MTEADTSQQELSATMAFPIVAVGVAARESRALHRLAELMPRRTGAAFLAVVQSDGEEDLDAVGPGSGQAQIPVVTAHDGLVPRPDHLYVAPPATQMVLQGGVLRLNRLDPSGNVRLLDDLFRSVACEAGEQSVAIVLAGVATGGVQGTREIQARDGVVIVQRPRETGPGEAVAMDPAERADFLLPLEAIPDALCTYLEQRLGTSCSRAVTADPGSEKAVAGILQVVRSRIGHDFSGYKKGTLFRRIHRRMALHHVPDLDAYASYLRDREGEAAGLARDLMIGVTSFFREPPVWGYLGAEILPQIIRRTPADVPLRAWVAGCATGEEAYTLAMVAIERMEAAGREPNLQVFATDVDREALDVARAGIYPAGIVADLEPQRLERFFSRRDDGWQVGKALREKVVFAPQNLLADPPFSRMDLVSCRNVLIYLEPQLQRQVLKVFHFAIRDGGFLVLGSSETIGQQREVFDPVVKKLRIFRRVGSARQGPLRLTPVEDRPPMAVAERMVSRQQRLAELAQKTLVHQFAPASVLIDERYRVLYFSGPTYEYLGQTAGGPTQDLLEMAREGLGVPLRAALHRAISGGTRATASALVRRQDHLCPVRICVNPVRDADPGVLLYLVSFQDSGEATKPDPAETGPAEDAAVRQLEEELRRTREDLQGTIDALEDSNDALKASNEEVMSMNEELQSTNEELETSKEELQSLNEELATVNHQLEQKVDEVQSSSDDLQNLLSSTSIATLFLDLRLRIKRFTPAITRLMNVIPTDVNRPFADLSLRFDDPGLPAALEQVLECLTPLEREVKADDGRWYLRRVHPYRTHDNRIDGVVITFADVTDLKAAQQDLRHSEQRFRTALDGSPITVFHQDLELRYTWMHNPVLVREPSLAIGRTDVELMGDVEDARRLEDLKRRVIGSQSGVREVVQHRHEGRTRYADLKLEPLHDDQGRVVGIAGAAMDITERREAERALARSEQRYRLLMGVHASVVWTADAHGRFVEPQPAWEAYTGQNSQDHIGWGWLNAIHPDDRKEMHRLWTRAREQVGEYRGEGRLWHAPTSGYRYFIARALPVVEEAGAIAEWVGTVTDVHDRKLAESELRRLNETLEQQVTERTAVADQRAAQLRALAGEVTAAEQRERRRVAQVLHDQVQQMLVAAKLHLNPLHGTGGEDSQAPLHQAEQLLDDAIRASRSLTLELSPPIFYERGLVAALEWLARRFGEEHHLRVEMDADPQAEMGNEDTAIFVFQAVRELLYNVVKHAGVSAARVTLRRREGNIEATVEDAGGFDLAQSQVREEAAEKFGLFSIRERVQLLGGSLLVQTSPGKGTRVSLVVPSQVAAPDQSACPAPAVAAMPPAAAHRPDEQRIAVMIVDDHPLLRSGLAGLIGCQPDMYTVGEAADGDDAVETAGTLRPDVILMDINLPRVNGVEATRRIVGQVRGVSVVGLSMHDTQEIIAAMRDAGAVDYVAKDAPPELLLAAIRRAADRAAALRGGVSHAGG